jgi:hypothetical protein
MRSRRPDPDKYQIYSRAVDQVTGEVEELYSSGGRPVYRRVRKPSGEVVVEVFEDGRLKERLVGGDALD